MAVLPVYNTLVVPDAKIYFKSDSYEKMTGKAPSIDDKVTIVIAKKAISQKEMDENSFYPIGVSGVITEINNNGYIVIRTRYRVNIEEVSVYKDYMIDLSISKRRDIEDIEERELEAKVKDIKAVMLRFSENFQQANMARAYISQLNTIGEIISAMSPWIMNSNTERYEILAEDSQRKRAEMMEQMIYENLEMFKLNSEAKTAQEEDYQKIYRESAIKKQMEYLQKELDEMHPENVSDLRKLEIKIEESGMNETARKEAEKILNRLKSEGQNSAESGMLYDYLDFVTSLSWKKEPAQQIDLDRAEKVLEEDHFGLKKVKERIIQQIAVMNLKKKQTGSILLFVGAPGTGKTSIGQSIARALMDGIHKSGVSNPVMVLDEVDKLSMSYNGDPASALLEVLDPEQNSTFTDHYMNVPYDLSDVMFICTANSLDTIPEPLLNRMEVIQFQGYSPLEKLQIARRHLLPKAMDAVGITEDDLLVADDVIAEIISGYTREGGVRGLKKRMDTLCRSAAVRIVRGHDGQLVIESDSLRDYLDMHPIRHGLVKDAAKPGIVTGLAWTAVGGEILYIETLFTKGDGKVTITGQLGDVMKESAQIAISLVKSLFPDKAELFEKHNLHIHVPDGSTPKDGPSAGITLTTALSSLINNKAVTPHTAMTGEVSLQGEVNPIGGLPEKLMAAQRAGVTRVFIPKDNEDDLRDVASEVKDQLTIIPVSRVEDVLKTLEILN